MQITWTSVLLDLPDADHDRAADFWAAVTGTARSTSSTAVTTLLPADGDPSVLLRRGGDGTPGVTLQLHVDEPERAVSEALALGASEASDADGDGDGDEDGRTLRSPSGFAFTLAPTSPTHRASVPTRPGGHRSALDQVCLDVPPRRHDAELRFWADLTGWRRDPQESPEFTALLPPAEQPVQVLVQRLDEGEGPPTAHLDLGTSAGARDAEVARHVALGATVVRPDRGWTVLRDPVGTTYCVTDHPPR